MSQDLEQARETGLRDPMQKRQALGCQDNIRVSKLTDWRGLINDSSTLVYKTCTGRQWQMTESSRDWAAGDETSLEKWFVSSTYLLSPIITND